MALKDSVVKRRRKVRPTAKALISDTLKRYGVSAPKSIAETIVYLLVVNGYLGR
jgi:hypothetical protein